MGASWFHPSLSRKQGHLVPKIGTEAARLTGAALQARPRRRKAPPLGASPRRLAAFGRPGSLRDPPTRHPHDEPASPARFCLFEIYRTHSAPIASSPPKPTVQMAFQKSQADRWRSDREGRGGGNVPTGAISSPPSPFWADHTKVHFTYARREPLTNAGE